MLAAQTTLPMQLRILWWERGLRDDIRRMCSVDPLTHKEYSDIEKAQSAACACDAHLFSAAAVTTDLATHTDLCDANSDDGDKSGDELPVHKRPCLTYNRHEKRRCYKCGRFGHIAAACPGQNEAQENEAATRDNVEQPVANESPMSIEEGNISH